MSIASSLNTVYRLANRHWITVFSLLGVGGVVAALLEIIGVGLLIPALGGLLSPGFPGDSPFRWLSVFGKFNSYHHYLIVVLVALGGFFLIKNFVQAGLAVFEARVVFAFHRYLTERLLISIFSFRSGKMLETPSAERASLLLADMASVVLHTVFPMLTIFSEVILALGLVAALMFFEPQLTFWISVTLLALGVAVTFCTRRYVYALGLRRQMIETRGLANLQQAFSGLREIFIYRAAQEAIRSHRPMLNELSDTHRNFHLASTLPRFLLESAATVVILVVVGISLLRGDSPAEVFVRTGVFAFVGFRLLIGTNRLVMSGQALRYGSASLLRIGQEVAELSSGNGAFGNSKNWSDVPAVSLELRGIDFSYGQRRLFDHLEFQAVAGEMIAIIGGSGVGKTTFLEILAGFRAPDNGSCHVNGVEAGLSNYAVAYVPQYPIIFPDSVRRNVALGVEDAEIDDALVLEALRSVGLDTLFYEGLGLVLGEGGRPLSGGQRQRVALARAIYHKANVLLLDEPTAGLDAATEQEVMEKLSALKVGRIIILVTHKVRPMMLCDKVYELANHSLKIVSKDYAASKGGGID